MSDAASNVIPLKSTDFFQSFEQMLQKLTVELKRPPHRSIQRFCFTFDGLNFEVHRVNRENETGFLVTATVGYMPFTIESIERREAIKTIIISSWRLPNVRFGVDTSSKISACALIDVSRIEKPDFIFYPLTVFMQEARPFIKLIGEYLLPLEHKAKAAG